ALAGGDRQNDLRTLGRPLPWSKSRTFAPFRRRDLAMYIDTHAHLYHKQFDQDRAEMVQRALDAGVHKLFLPNIDLTSVEAMHLLCDQFPEVCFPMMGLH